MIAAALAIAIPRAARAADSGAVVATVGDHKITEAELDAKIKPQMAPIESKIYDLKHDALQSMTDQYLVEQAAKQQHVSVDEYLKKQLSGKIAKISEADAQKYYDAHKGPGVAPFAQIKDRLINAMEQQNAAEARDQLLASLRKQTPVKILIKPPRVAVNAEGNPSIGPASAPVTIVEFSDFQCPFCKRAEPTVKQILKKYGDKVRLVYVDYPLPMHNHALDASKAARCANDQGKFWQFHDAMFSDQAKLAPADLKATAKKLGLDSSKFDACFDKAKYETEISKEVAQGRQLGIDGTPTFYIDGRQLVGAQPPEQFEQIIDQELADKGAGGAQTSRR